MCRAGGRTEARVALQQCSASFFCSGLSNYSKGVMKMRWGASMVSTEGLTRLSAPGSIPGRSSRNGLPLRSRTQV